MISIFEKFTEDLTLPPSVLESLGRPRNNEELKIFSLAVPDPVYPDTYILAGRLYIYLNILTAPKTIKSYVSVLEGILRPEIVDFLNTHQEELDKNVRRYLLS